MLMAIPACLRHFLPPALASAGILLMAGAWPAARAVTRPYSLPFYRADLLVWLSVSVLAAFYVYRRRRAFLCRFVAASSLFAFSVIPWDIRQITITAQSLSLCGIMLLTGGCIAWQDAHPWLYRAGNILHRHRLIPSWLFAGGAFAAFLAAAVALAWYCFAFIPAIPDSTAQYLHGKFAAAGHPFFIPSHRLREFFPVWMMVNDGRWYSQYQPLHQFLLALGHLAGAPWLINPLAGALTLLSTYALARRIYDEPTARLAALLTLGCQFMLIMSAEYMNHATALLWATLFIWCYVETLSRRGQPAADGWALAAGLALGALFLTRPLSAVGIGLPFLFHALALTWRRWRRYLPLFSIMAAGATLCLAFQSWYNLQTTGDMLLFPYARYHYNAISRVMGFGGPISLWGRFAKLHAEWIRMNLSLFEWSLPCTFFAMLACLTSLKRPHARLLAATVASYTLVNMANRFTSMIFGPRYLYELSSTLIVLTAAGMCHVPLLLRFLRLAAPPRRAVHAMTALAVILLSTTALLWRLPDNFRKYSNQYIDNHPRFYQAMLRQSAKPALIFVGRPEKGDPKDLPVVKYRWVAFTNPPDDDAPVIFAIDLGDRKNQRLVDYYPGRHAYVERRGRLFPIRPRPHEPPKQP